MFDDPAEMIDEGPKLEEPVCRRDRSRPHTSSQPLFRNACVGWVCGVRGAAAAATPTHAHHTPECRGTGGK